MGDFLLSGALFRPINSVVRLLVGFAVLAIAVGALARNPMLPFHRWFEAAPAQAHVSNADGAAAYVKRATGETDNVSCAAGSNGWTYICSYTDDLGRRQAGVLTRGGVVRDFRRFVPGQAIQGPQPLVTESQYAAALERACADRAEVLSAFPPSYSVHPEQSRAVAELMISVEDRFGRELWAAGSIALTGPAGGNRLYLPFKVYDAELKGLPAAIGHPADLRAQLAQMHLSEGDFDSTAAEMGIGCRLP